MSEARSGGPGAAGVGVGVDGGVGVDDSVVRVPKSFFAEQVRSVEWSWDAFAHQLPLERAAYDDDGPSSGPRALPRDSDRARRMDPRRDMRGRILGWLKRGRVSRFVGDLRGQLAGEWGNLGRFRGRADTRGGTDSARPTGPTVVRRVVKS